MQVRPPAIAGHFYPAAPAELAATVAGLLVAGEVALPRQPKALIVPHAGYAYSGAVAGCAFAALAPWRARIRRVLLLGPCHRALLEGIALPQSDAFATPLGEVMLDRDGLAALRTLPGVVVSDAAHMVEHSLEVQLPLLQCALDDFTLLPLAVGRAAPHRIAAVLAQQWGGDETLIVISTDLSHFLPYDIACHVDADTCEHILQLDGSLQPAQACGAHPLNGLLQLARQRGLRPTLLRRCNSGDSGGGNSQRVVGYAAFALLEDGSDEPGC